MIQRRELAGIKDLNCPKCGSKNIMTQPGEIAAEKHTIHECKCKTCDCDFLVSRSIMKK